MLTLAPHTWYGWQMLPGYTTDGYQPYFSPIFVHEVNPLKTGNHVLRLAFANAMASQGPQSFVLDLRVTTRAASYLVGELVEPENVKSPRCAVISRIDFAWLRQYCPELVKLRPPERYSGFTQSSPTLYLNEVFGVGKAH